MSYMDKTDTITIRCTPAMRAALAAIRDRDGVPVGEQIRRAVDAWIKTKRRKGSK